jgi:hypothetical protein
VKWIDGFRAPNGCTPTPCCTKTEYLIEKDTLIANLLYHKLVKYFTNQAGCGNPLFPPTIFPVEDAVYFRNDSSNRKVWYKEFPNSTDTLLYDFDLILNQIYPNTFISANLGAKRVDSIRTDTFFGEARKVYFLNDTLFGLPSETIELVEGIGANSGFLNEMALVGLGFNLFSLGQCVKGFDKDLQPCALTVGIIEQNTLNVNDWKYYYNTTTHSIVISGDTVITQLKVNDLSGRQVGEYRPESDQVNVKLNQGIYLLQAVDIEGNFYSGKLPIN